MFLAFKGLMNKFVLSFILISILSVNIFASGYEAKNLYLNYDKKARKIVATTLMKNSMCFQSAAAYEIQSANDIVEGIQRFLDKKERPFESIEQNPDKDIYDSFIALKLEIENPQSSASKLSSLVRKFFAFYEQTEEVASYRAYSRSVIKKMFAHYASLNSLDNLLNERVYINHRGDLYLPKDYLVWMSPENLDYYVQFYKLKEFSYRESDDILEDINLLGSVLHNSSHIDNVSNVLVEDLRNIKIMNSIGRVFPDALSRKNEEIYILSDRQYVIDQFLEFAKNPRKLVCGEPYASATPVTDFCILNDTEFVLKLQELAEAANTDAKHLKMSDQIVLRSFVGFKGKQCSLRGSYYLRKINNNTVYMHTLGKIYVNKNENEKNRFDEFDILSALGADKKVRSEVHFKLENQN